MMPSIATKFQYVNSPFLFFFSLTTCFGPYGPSSGEMYTIRCFQALFLLQRIRCTYTTWLIDVICLYRYFDPWVLPTVAMKHSVFCIVTPCNLNAEMVKLVNFIANISYRISYIHYEYFHRSRLHTRWSLGPYSIERSEISSCLFHVPRKTICLFHSKALTTELSVLSSQGWTRN
jgi:hypothetical protein